jgi:subtilisin
VLAHHADFNGGFANRDARRVERLFQMLKENAQPIGHPWLAGAGLPDASRALGLPSQPRQQKVELNDLLAEMRSAVGRLDVISPGIATETTEFEPPRGPANVTPLSLNPFPMTFAVGSGSAPGMHGLKAAMISAGLCGNRYY